MASKNFATQSAKVTFQSAKLGVEELKKMDPETRSQMFGMSSNVIGRSFSAANSNQYESYPYDIADQIKRPITGLLDIIYDHHGIYIGGGMVIDFLDCGVRIVHLKDFNDGKESKKVSKKRKFSRAEVCLRAFSFFIGEKNFGEYDLFSNNCEHFVNFCITGNCVSKQAQITKDVAEFLLNWTIAVGSILLKD